MSQQIFEVEKLVHGGMGIVRDGVRTIFVPFAVPGEKIRIRVEPGRRKMIIAQVTEIVSSSPERVLPPCRLFGLCGGCQLQHVSYAAQLRLKREILQENMMRISSLSAQVDPLIGSPDQYFYRTRIKFHVVKNRPGFFAPGEKKFIPVDYCHLAAPPLNMVLPTLSSLIGREKPKTVELIANGNDIISLMQGQRGHRIFLSRGAEWERAGEMKVAFTQVNPGQNENLRAIVSDLVGEINPGTVIELYAGSGNLSEVIAGHCSRLTAVDTDAAAVEIGKDFFRDADLEHVAMINSSAESFMDQALSRGEKADLVALDPPRSGAREVMPAIVEMRPAHVVYVSCDPPTLARDIKPLTAAGYALRRMIPIDMFPQTAHIETVAWLSLA